MWRVFRPRGVFSIVVLVGLGLSCAPYLVAGERCDVQLNAELKTKEQTGDLVRVQFEVDLASGARCTAVSYDLILEEMLPNQQWKSVRKMRRVELSDTGSTIDLIEHVMTADLELLDHRTQIIGCECRASSDDPEDPKDPEDPDQG